MKKSHKIALVIALAVAALVFYFGIWKTYPRYLALRDAYTAANPGQPSPYTWSWFKPFAY